MALLFCAGHGVTIDGVNYLLPTDADASSAETLAETSLPLAEAQEAIQSIAPVAIILLAPLCAALLSADLATRTPKERGAMLMEAAQSYETFQTELQRVRSDAPRVAGLRSVAEEQLTLRAFDAALQTGESLAAEFPTDTMIRRNLSVSYERIGDMVLAEEDYTASLETAERLVQLAPGRAEPLHDRLVTLNRLGDAQAAMGDNRAAVDSFKAMVADGDALLDIDPFSQPWANDVSLGLERLGNAQTATGDVAAALKSHQDALALRDWLVNQNPSDPGWYRNLALSKASVAAALADREDYQTALIHQDESLRIMRGLASGYHDDPVTASPLSAASAGQGLATRGLSL